ncbi:DUF29 domain-containing protein [Azospirillum sp. YIM B02556]|uniref:DUF29 domain-containing protein n=1 Tax=Azospirillum endophyticum TaxID=2800326 RepID=A0ABS1FDB3_9PROT|nr:DUF29 domain-containing protein [Azospirillum endophyticum]
MSLYDSDFYGWTQDQAAALRRLANERPNVGAGIDWEHVAEEIENLSSDTLEKIEDLVAQIVAHLLRLEYCPDAASRNHWRGEVTAWRNTVRRWAKRSPAALKRLDIAELTEDAVAELRARYDDQPWVKELPAGSAYTITELLDRDWWPVNRTGLED